MGSLIHPLNNCHAFHPFFGNFQFPCIDGFEQRRQIDGGTKVDFNAAGPSGSRDLRMAEDGQIALSGPLPNEFVMLPRLFPVYSECDSTDDLRGA